MSLNSLINIEKMYSKLFKKNKIWISNAGRHKFDWRIITESVQVFLKIVLYYENWFYNFLEFYKGWHGKIKNFTIFDVRKINQWHPLSVLFKFLRFKKIKLN